MVCPYVSRVGKEIDLYILKLTMVILEEGVITHAYQKKGCQSLHTPQEGLYHNCPTRGYPCNHTPYQTLRPLHCPSLSKTIPSITNKTGLPKHFNSDTTHTRFLQTQYTPVSSNTKQIPPSLSLQTSALFNLVSLHSFFRLPWLNLFALRHCYL